MCKGMHNSFCIVHLWIKSTDCLQLQFLTELDGGDLRRGVFVIGATNR